MTNKVQYPFEFIGKGKVNVDGEVVEAEIRFTGIQNIDNEENTKITFDLIPQGEDQVLYDLTIKPE
jgi:hypothetical protein